MLALQVLYECDLTQHEWRSALEAHADELHATHDAVCFAENCIEGVVKEQGNLDALIQRHQHQWPVEQLAAVDRAVLRLGLFELADGSSTPPVVAINEAVELAKTFGSDGSARFVNGVLGASFNEQQNRTAGC
ncbi:MAG: transcription antitermination factor NusB [Chloroflexi bacterium]|nr:transcription antitermination factor NusB [Chloroflexota bacterium]